VRNVKIHTHTHTHPFNGPLSRTTRVSRYQKGKTNLDFTEARDNESQWHQLGRIQVCTSLQTDNHASTPTTQVFTGRMPFLPPNQQRQSTEGSRKSACSKCPSSAAMQARSLLRHSLTAVSITRRSRPSHTSSTRCRSSSTRPRLVRCCKHGLAESPPSPEHSRRDLDMDCWAATKSAE